MNVQDIWAIFWILSLSPAQQYFSLYLSTGKRSYFEKTIGEIYSGEGKKIQQTPNHIKNLGIGQFGECPCFFHSTNRPHLPEMPYDALHSITWPLDKTLERKLAASNMHNGCLHRGNLKECRMRQWTIFNNWKSTSELVALPHTEADI